MGDEGIYVDFEDGFYYVIFWDENGESRLDKTRSRVVAERSAKKFKSDLKKGILLKENPRVFK